MALDAIYVKGLVHELNQLLVGAKIDKIYQSEKDELILSIRGFNYSRENRESYKLLLSASASCPRIHITKFQKTNPDKPPMFCMLLRKHLVATKIVSITMPKFERVVDIALEGYNEFGDLCIRHLITEIMGRYSNIILTDEEYKIIDSIKRVDISISSQRQVLSGLYYQLPPEQEKINPLTATRQEIFNALWDNKIMECDTDKALLASIGGISPIISREIAYEAELGGTYFSQLTNEQIGELADVIFKMFQTVNNNEYVPEIIIENGTDRMLDFHILPIKQYGNLVQIKPMESISDVVDEFYRKRDSADRVRQKTADLTKLINNYIERAAKKIVLQTKTLKDASEKEKFKIKGDLLMANLYQFDENCDKVTVQNFYDPEMKNIDIVLDKTVSPSHNAQNFYKKYNKAKTAEVEVAKQLALANADLEYLESTQVLLQNSDGESEINAIKQELATLGYVRLVVEGKRGSKPKKKDTKSFDPHHYISSDGFDIYVGKNNTQNDVLTLKFANSQDIWFHTKNIPGSHTVIKLGIDKDVPDTTIVEAATLAAYHSKGQSSSSVPVDYTIIKNVKKPNGAKPGMVIYDVYNTIYVTPSEKLIESLKVKVL